MDGIIIIIKKLRKFNGITQEGMAEQLHLSVRAYQKIESGQTRIDIDRIEQIAEILGVSVSDLVNAKYNAENHLFRSKLLSKENATGMKRILEEWSTRIMYALIKAKGEEVSYLHKTVEEGL